MKPKPIAGMHHVAIYISNFEETEEFYTNVLGMAVEWRPDDNNLYLTSGKDNLALHRRERGEIKETKLDHIGFIIDEIDQVDVWFEHMKEKGVHALTKPRTHRDGARSFYCEDPDGTRVQLIYHPPLSGRL